MLRKKPLALILFLSMVCLLLPLWMVFHASSTSGLTKSFSLVLVFLFFCATPMYPMYLQIKRRPQYTLPILLLIAALACAMAYGFVQFVLHLDSHFADWIANVFRVLIVATCLLFMWKGLRTPKGSAPPAKGGVDPEESATGRAPDARV